MATDLLAIHHGVVTDMADHGDLDITTVKALSQNSQETKKFLEYNRSENFQ